MVWLLAHIIGFENSIEKSVSKLICLFFLSLNFAAKHPYPLNYRVVIYIQHIGVGVCVGHAWQEGKELQRVLQRLCTGILMVKNTI